MKFLEIMHIEVGYPPLNIYLGATCNQPFVIKR